MHRKQVNLTDTFPLFLTPAAQAGSILPSALLHEQFHILLSNGVSWDRLHPELRAAFLLGYYIGNVRNGGHSQFMGNARNFYHGDPMLFLDWAMEAAKRYKMPQTLNIMQDVKAWMVENPKEAEIQMGFTPYVSSELKPHDTALLDADMIDEKTWLARVNSLPKAHAQAFLNRWGYDKGFMRFPAMISLIEEHRFLAAFDTVMVLPDGAFEEEVKAAVAADPIAKAARMAARMADLAQALPKPATCAALSLFKEGTHLPPTECLRAGAAKLRRTKDSGVLTTVRGDRGFILELRKESISVFEAIGDPDAELERSVNFPSIRVGLASRLFYPIDPRKRHERRIKRRIRHKAIRKNRKLGEVADSVGNEIAALNRRFHMPEALALWLEQAQGSPSPVKWRLQQVDAESIHWRFEVMGAHLDVIATQKEVQISTSGTTRVYKHEDLHALRQSIEGNS